MGIIFESLRQFWYFTGFANASWQNLVMILIGIVFITLAIKKEWEPLLLVPIGFGMIIGNIPMFPGLNIGVYEDGSVLNTLYQGVKQGWYPPLIFLGIGAMTDFSALISQPRLLLIGAAGRAVLRVLRRFQARFAFTYQATWPPQRYTQQGERVRG